MKPVGAFSDRQIATSFANRGVNVTRVMGRLVIVGPTKKSKRGLTKSPINKRKQK